jgi:nucleoid DNA-binding protein
MNTTELVDAVAASQGIAKAEVRKTVDAVLPPSRKPLPRAKKSR